MDEDEVNIWPMMVHEMESTGKSIAVGALEYHNTVEIYPQE